MQKIRRVGIDFKFLRNPFCGIGHVALQTFKRLIKYEKEDLEIKYYTYPKYISEKNKCIQINWWHGLFFSPKNIDVWHATHQMARLPSSRKIKKILTIHDTNFVYEKKEGSKREKYLKRFTKNVKESDYLVFISKFAQEETKKLIDISHKKQEIIYNGVDISTDERGEKNIELPEKFIFSIGELKEKKNFRVLIEMLPFLDKEIHLVLAGNQDFVKHKETLVNIAKTLNVEERIIWLGKIDEQEKINCNKNCLAFVFPSLYEGFGIPPIEAMRLGKPVFLSTKTSLPEIGGEYAFYWEHFEPKYMAEVFEEKMSFYNSNPDYSQKLIDYSQRYDWDENVARYIEIYKEI